jgi:hypothetical protein
MEAPEDLRGLARKGLSKIAAVSSRLGGRGGRLALLSGWAMRLRGEADAALAEAEGPQAPGPARGPDRLGDEEGQAGSEGLQDLYHWMASWREGGKTRRLPAAPG